LWGKGAHGPIDEREAKKLRVRVSVGVSLVILFFRTQEEKMGINEDSISYLVSNGKENKQKKGKKRNRQERVKERKKKKKTF